MSNLDDEIAAFNAERNMLETRHMGKWVIYYDRHLTGVFETFEDAAADAMPKFGREPFLIRQVGAPALVLPASIMYHVI